MSSFNFRLCLSIINKTLLANWCHKKSGDPNPKQQQTKNTEKLNSNTKEKEKNQNLKKSKTRWFT